MVKVFEAALYVGIYQFHDFEQELADDCAPGVPARKSAIALTHPD
jgi:hypothetical protein